MEMGFFQIPDGIALRERANTDPSDLVNYGLASLANNPNRSRRAASRETISRPN